MTTGKTASRIAIMAGMKGGTGKTTLVVISAIYLRNLGYDVAVFDADAGVSSTYLALRDPALSEEQQDPRLGAVRYDIRDRDEAIQFARSLECPARTIITDLPGGSIGDLEGIFTSGDGNGLEQLPLFAAHYGRRITLFHLITPDRAHAASVRGFTGGFGANADYVAVLNKGLMRPGESFAHWLTSDAREEFLALGGREIELPEIPRHLVPLGFSAFQNPAELPRFEQFLVHNYFAEFAKQFDKIADWVF